MKSLSGFQNWPHHRYTIRGPLLQMVVQRCTRLVDGSTTIFSSRRSGGGGLRINHHPLFPFILQISSSHYPFLRWLRMFLWCVETSGGGVSGLKGHIFWFRHSGLRRQPCGSLSYLSAQLYSLKQRPSVTQTYFDQQPLPRLVDASPPPESPCSEYSLNWLMLPPHIIAPCWKILVVWWPFMVSICCNVLQEPLNVGKTFGVWAMVSFSDTLLDFINNKDLCRSFVHSWLLFVRGCIVALSLTGFSYITTWVGERRNILIFVKSYSRSFVSLLFDIRMTSGVFPYGLVHLFRRMLYLFMVWVEFGLALSPLSWMGVAACGLDIKIGLMNGLCFSSGISVRLTLRIAKLCLLSCNYFLGDSIYFGSCVCNPSGVG